MPKIRLFPPTEQRHGHEMEWIGAGVLIPAGRLTLAQLRDIHTGKIANWKQVGGRDQAIAIYVAPPRRGALGRGFVEADGRLKVIDTPKISRPLALVTLGEPSPPDEAGDRRVQAVVGAQALIRDGAVREVTILSGPRVFHSAVREAMLQYKCGAVPGDLVAEQESAFRTRAND